MAMLQDVFQIGSALLSAAARVERRQKLEVAQHFQNLANVYLAFPIAHKANDQDRIVFLLAKTRSLIQSIEGSSLFETVLGTAQAKAFLDAARNIINEKEALSKMQLAEAKYTAIANAAGFLEGYAESLRAQAGDS